MCKTCDYNVAVVVDSVLKNTLRKKEELLRYTSQKIDFTLKLAELSLVYAMSAENFVETKLEMEFIYASQPRYFEQR